MTSKFKKEILKIDDILSRILSGHGRNGKRQKQKES
jgi:hypothetical protein